MSFRRWAESAHTAAASRWRRPYRAGAWSERTACTTDRDVLPRRRRMKKRCTSSLSAGGRDAAGSVTNGERERSPQPCVRYSEERQTRQACSIVYSGVDYRFLHKIVLYSVYVPLSDITSFKNNAPTHQVELCFVHVWYTTSVGKLPLHAFKLARGLPFRTEMSSTVYPHGCGWA